MGCISFSRSAVPPGIQLLRRIRSKDFSFDAYRTSVLLLTFIAYTLYHASRKPASIVKDVLKSDSAINSFLPNPLPPWPLQQFPDSRPFNEEGPPYRPQVPNLHPHSDEGLHAPLLSFIAFQNSGVSPRHYLHPSWPRQQLSDVNPNSNIALVNRPHASDKPIAQFFDGHFESGGGPLNSLTQLIGQQGPSFINEGHQQTDERESYSGQGLLEKPESFEGHVGRMHSNGILPHSQPVRLGAGRLKGWAPFNTDQGTALLGEVDVAFLASYAIGMYFAGHLGDRLCNRWFLTVGMIGSGICVSLFGMAYWWNIHWLGYFFIVQIIAGFFQATGWPSVVTVVAKWFGKRKRGLVMGIWNAHTSVGNILGSLISAGMLKYGWGWAFIVPGISIAFGGFLIFLFLVVDPLIVGFPSQHDLSGRGSRSRRSLPISEEQNAVLPDSEQGLKSQPLLANEEASDSHDDAVGFFKAWTIPGVAAFALCLFFTKLVAYTFLYWLPFYISNTAIQGKYLSDATSGNLSTIFDVGGVLGGILAGYLSDKMRARAATAASFMYLSIPMLLIYYSFGSVSLWLNLVLMFILGMFVNGPYALITTAVSADLGTHKSLKGNSKALGTVTAIIDGTGSVGAAIGPLLTGYISESGWNSVFYMLMISAFLAGLLLTKLVVAEVKEIISRKKAAASGQS